MTFGFSETGGVWIAACNHSTGWSYLTPFCSGILLHGWQHWREMPWSNKKFTSRFISPLSSLITKVPSWVSRHDFVMAHKRCGTGKLLQCCCIQSSASADDYVPSPSPWTHWALSYIHQSSWKAGPEHPDIEMIHKSNGKSLCISFQLWSARWTLTNYFSQISPALSYKQ